MNMVDSSGWLEYFTGTENSRNFVRPIEDTENLIVSSISIFEVFKRLLQQVDESLALKAIGHMKMARVIDINFGLAVFGAKLSNDLKIPMADSLILATAKKYNAVLYTQDKDFEGIQGVKYFKKDS